MSKLHPLLEAYLNGELDDQGFADFNDWLREDPAHLREWAITSFIAQELGEALSEQNAGTEQSLVIDRIAAVERGQLDAEVLSLLQQIEASSKDAPLRHIGPATTIDLDGSDSIDFGTAVREMRWAAGKVARHLIASKPVLLSGLAAMLLITVTLFFVLQGDSDDGTPGMAVIPEKSQTPDQPTALTQVLATLTATHHAQWEPDFDFGTPEPGDVFRAGRTLTLLDGFAELTTAKDAAVVLEAPCTIAFDEADNALRLIAGKLVADVPEQAIGFTVSTPTARVIDYGTRFGVEVRSDGATNAAVFTGEIELSEISEHTDQPTRNVRLTTGWSSQVSSKGSLHREPKPVTAEHLSRFATSLEDVASPSFAYRRAVLASGPALYWGFDERTPKTANLAGHASLAGHAIGQTEFADGLFGSALKVSGQVESMGGFTSDNRLTITDPNRYTLEAWVWVNEPHRGRVMGLAELSLDQSRKSPHFSMVEILGGEALTEVLKSNDSSFRFMHRSMPFESGIAGKNIYAKTDALLGQWVHVVSVRDAKEAHLYLNGELISSSRDVLSEIAVQQLGLVVGVSPHIHTPQLVSNETEFRCFNGLIDEVAVYDYALKADRIALHHQLGLQQSPLGDE